ncbi:MAG: TonB-dependent receptor [Bacteroidota bacterium]
MKSELMLQPIQKGKTSAFIIIYLTVLLCCVCPVLVSAQNNQPQLITVSGSVADSAANRPIGLVTVVLQDPQTHAAVKSGLTKDDGSFSLKAPAGKTYQLALVFVGYSTKLVNINSSSSDVDLGKLLLSSASSQLKEVSVIAARPLMKQEVDRITYDIQADPDSKQQTVLDMMRKVPLLSVDANDNIRLKGSGNYKILINGKESALMAKNPSDILKSMPAVNIDKIEVITTPPAKYDAEGLAGLINIITKRRVDQGYNVGMFTRLNSTFGPGVNVNGTFKQGKFGMAFFGGVGRSFNSTGGNKPTALGSTENIFANQNTLTQSGTTYQNGNIHYGGTELSFEIDTLNLLTASVNLFGENLHLNNQQLSALDSLEVIKQTYNWQNTGKTNSLGLDLAVNYQLGFKNSKNKLLTFSYKYSYAPNSQFNDNMFSDRFNYPVSAFPDYQQYNKAGNRDHTVQLDYAGPLTKQIEIEAGAKGILRSNYSNFHVDDRDTIGRQYLTNSQLTNDFTYHQDIYSLYNSYQLKMDKWAGKVGLRLERTAISADFVSAGVTTAPSYNNLIPSVSIQRAFENSSINLGFTQRIQRPGIFQLNPFVDRSNPAFITTGNPALKPELDNTFDLTYSNFAKGSVNIDLSYAFSNNSIQNVSSLQVQNINNRLDTVTYTTFQNLGTNKTLGLNVNTNLSLSKNLTLSLNGQFNYIQLSGIFDSNAYKNHGFTGSGFGNVRYRFGNSGYAFSFNAGYFSGTINLQGRTADNIFNQYLFTKDFLNKKLTIGLAANNPYSKFYTYRTTIRSADFYQTTYTQTYNRSFALRFNYRFGKLKADIKKNAHGIENDDTKGKDNGNRPTGN